MSAIGDPCERKLWYNWRWCSPPQLITGRVQRIFDTGHRAEAFMVADLNKIGIETFMNIDGISIPMTGHKDERQEEIVGIAGHAKGHIDGRCLGVIEAPRTVHLLEMKTHNEKSFNDVKKKGVKASKPVHYAQMQRYMTGLGLDRALYMAYNKNTSAYYIERVKLDESFAQDLIRKEEIIIISEHPPEKKFDKTWFECKWCNNFDICHGDSPVQKSCRTCEHSDLQSEGRWVCTITEANEPLPTELQRVGCGLWALGIHDTEDA
jgi:hypothetical protein